MDYLKTRQKTRSRLYSKVTIFGLAILLAFLVKPTWQIFLKSLESKDNLRKAELELANLESRKKQLTSDVAYLKTDYGLDQEIRNKFGVAKTGETMVVIVRDNKEIPPPVVVPEPGFVKKIWSGFLSTFGLD